MRTQAEREAREKRKLEDAVMEKMMQQLTMDKSSQYTRKSVERLQVHKEKLVCETVAGGDIMNPPTLVCRRLHQWRLRMR